MSKFFQNRTVLILFSICYLSLLIYLLFFAFFREGTTTRVNLIPFKSIAALTSYTFQSGHGIMHWMINVPGNIIAFIPLPFIFHLFRFSKPKFWNVLFFSASIPLIAESIQYYFELGSLDIDDWMLNFVGMLIGYFFLIKKQKQPAN